MNAPTAQRGRPAERRLSAGVVQAAVKAAGTINGAARALNVTPTTVRYWLTRAPVEQDTGNLPPEDPARADEVIHATTWRRTRAEMYAWQDRRAILSALAAGASAEDIARNRGVSVEFVRQIDGRARA